MLKHPEKSSGLNLKVSVDHVSLSHLASTFTEVTGKPAKATNITIYQWFDEVGWSNFTKDKRDFPGQAGRFITAGSLSKLFGLVEDISASWREQGTFTEGLLLAG